MHSQMPPLQRYNLELDTNEYQGLVPGLCASSKTRRASARYYRLHTKMKCRLDAFPQYTADTSGLFSLPGFQFLHTAVNILGRNDGHNFSVPETDLVQSLQDKEDIP